VDRSAEGAGNESSVRANESSVRAVRKQLNLEGYVRSPARGFGGERGDLHISRAERRRRRKEHHSRSVARSDEGSGSSASRGATLRYGESDFWFISSCKRLRAFAAVWPYSWPRTWPRSLGSWIFWISRATTRLQAHKEGLP
jgi:hypothetical protein